MGRETRHRKIREFFLDLLDSDLFLLVLLLLLVVVLFLILL